MKKTIGILAHVDAGKTTFSEQILFLARAIRALGRVDHQSAFLDIHPIEKQRGITIFSDQAMFSINGDTYFWVDTPGHVDFVAEMERQLPILDAAVVIVNCAEGVQSHTETIWRLLGDYAVPTLVFLNKLDREGADPVRVITQMRSLLSADVLDLRAWQNGQMEEPAVEALAERDEALFSALFDQGYDEALWVSSLRRQVASRAVFPVFAGAALTGLGVDSFLARLHQLICTGYEAHEAEPFSARCYKVRHDEQGNRLCFIKALTGRLCVKDAIALLAGEEDKAHELRLYHGEKYSAVQMISAGDLAALPHLAGVRPGDMLGAPGGSQTRLPPAIEPMLAASVSWGGGLPADRVLAALRMLEEEDPALQIHHQPETEFIELRGMGGIQLEVIRQLMQDRYGLSIHFGPFRVLYRETVAAPCVGIGHYEPLRHYAEVHLRLVPGPQGSGLTFRSLCHVDTLALHWQRLIETHVFEKQHRGVLTGAPLTDVRVELLSGRAHLKHTEGGDFRESTYRAIRNALMHGQSVLLEPICRFRLRAPAEAYGRLMGDLLAMRGCVDSPEYEGDRVHLTGTAPFSLFSGYRDAFLTLTRGNGSLSHRMDHYAPCPDAQAIITASGYQPLADDTPDSVFCQNGAGFTVPWDQVKAHAHCKPGT